MDYSTLFKFGLLSDAVPSTHDSKPVPWAADADSYMPRRRESLPSTIDEISLIVPTSLPANVDVAESIASGDSSSFYFTVRRKRSKEHRSFLSLDLAESQSLRSASLQKKDSSRTPRSGRRANTSDAVTPTPNSS